ncbi:hypothetical protein SK128_017235 [Halocaridina rubra]|uniref:Uncharacterized protein n=1 Tax=Halocaridina rubra TaxID=373956 RepID=A0AAN8X437_HALRR
MGRSSFSAGTPDSSFSEEGGTSSFHLGGKRKASAPVTSRSSFNTSVDSQPGSRGGSRPPSRGPGSRPGSRPPSRAGSEVSLDSYDGGKSSMKRTPSFTGRTRVSSSQSSGVQRSSSLRKASAPVKPSSGTVNGTSTRAISVSSRLSSLKRAPSASSIPVAVSSISALAVSTTEDRESLIYCGNAISVQTISNLGRVCFDFFNTFRSLLYRGTLNVLCKSKILTSYFL